MIITEGEREEDSHARCRRLPWKGSISVETYCWDGVSDAQREYGRNANSWCKIAAAGIMLASLRNIRWQGWGRVREIIQGNHTRWKETCKSLVPDLTIWRAPCSISNLSCNFQPRCWLSAIQGWWWCPVASDSYCNQTDEFAGKSPWEPTPPNPITFKLISIKGHCRPLRRSQHRFARWLLKKLCQPVFLCVHPPKPVPFVKYEDSAWKSATSLTKFIESQDSIRIYSERC